MAVLTDPGDTKDTDAQGHELGDEHLNTGNNDNYRLSDQDQAKFDDIAKNYDNDDAGSGGSSGSSGGSSSNSTNKTGKAQSDGAAGKPGASASSSGAASSASSGPSSRFGAAIRRGRGNKTTNYALIAVMLAAVLSGGFFSILPLKLESMMKNIIEKRVEARLKHYMTKRLTVKVKKYFKDSVAESDAQFKQNIATDDPATKDFEQDYRNADAEKILQQDSRIKLTRSGGTVNVSRDGAVLGSVEKATSMLAAFDGMMNIARTVTDLYRAPLRYMAEKDWGVGKWRFFKNEKDPQKASVEVTTEFVADASVQVGEGDVAIINCALSEGDCPSDESNPDPAKRVVPQGPDTQASQTGGSNDQAVSDAVNQAGQDATSQTNGVLQKLDYLKYLNPNHYIALVISKALTHFLDKAITQAITKLFSAAAGPLLIISAVDIASRIDHFFWYGGADKVLVNIHKIQYAAQFVEWSTVADQWKSGQNVSGAEFNSVNGMLNGTENSAASRSIYGTGTGGQSLYQLNDGSTNKTSRSIDEHSQPIADEYRHKILPDIEFPLGAIPIPGLAQIGQGQAYVLHYALTAWYDTLGKVWGLIQKLLSYPVSWIMSAIRLIPGVGTAIDWVTQHIGYILGKLLMYLIRPAVDGTEVGAELMNGIDAGGAVAGMDFARNLGGHQLSAPQTAALNKEVFDEQQQATAHMSIATRLFSTDYAQSGVNLLALQMPSTPSGALGNTLNYAASIIAKPYEAFMPAFDTLFGKANADALYNQQYGLNDWGFTDQDLASNDTAALTQAYQNAASRLNVPVASVHLGDLQLSDCPAMPDPDHQANLCRLDIASMRAASSAFNSSDDGGINSPW